MPHVNPDILIWARETAGLSLAEAAQLIGLKEARGQNGEDRLLALEQGEKEPSRPLLVRMSEKYRRPLLAFYLKEPPRRGDRGEDFRAPLGTSKTEDDPTLDALIRDINARQGTVKSLLEDEGIIPLPFIGSMQIEQGVREIAESIISTLSFNLTEFRINNTKREAFNYLREKIESINIFVILAGNLGSHHTNISPELFRGFAISDPIAPFIIINDQDAESAWSFTALHELTHLWLGTTGISGLYSEAIIERFCNDVAAAILISKNELQELVNVAGTSFDETVNQVTKFSNIVNLSRSFIAYNMFREDLISEHLWHELRIKFYQEWIDGRTRYRERQKEKSGGPNYYVIRRSRLGNALLGLIRRSLDEGSITPTKAGHVLGVKPRNVEMLFTAVNGGV